MEKIHWIHKYYCYWWNLWRYRFRSWSS